MSVPPEYTEALANLKAFRNKILVDLISARTLAGLDANHLAMQKYDTLISELVITPYLFGVVRQKALALRIDTKDVGTGLIRQAGVTYIGNLAKYPMTPPYTVPQRDLPQVDVYVYETIKDIEILEKTDVSSLKSYVLIQATSGTFEEPPNAENAFYDYYEVSPQYRMRGVWSVFEPDPYFSTVIKLRGEYIYFERRLTKTGETTDKPYLFYLWMEGSLYTSDALHDTPPAILYTPIYAGEFPIVSLNIAGQRVSSDQNGIYTMPKTAERPFLMGWQHLANGLVLETETVVWKNSFKVTVTVNDLNMGITDPPPDVYEKQGKEDFIIEALPKTGYVFDHWERDGVNKGNTNPNTFVICDGYVIEAVFASA